MRLDRIPEYVTSAVVILLGLIFAVGIGNMTGEGQMKVTGLVLVSAISITACIMFRQRLWLLIPFAWELTGFFTFLQIPFTARDLAIMLVLAAYLVFYAMKMIRGKVVYDLIDLLIIANLAYLCTVFLRNPVGLKVFNSDMVGGRPYFNIALAFFAFWVMQRAPANLRDIRFLPLILLAGAAVSSAAGMLIDYAPDLAGWLGQFYSTFTPPDVLEAQASGTDVIGRKAALSVIGSVGIRVLVSYFVPLTLILPFYPVRFFATALSFLAILLSGFRSAFFTAVVYVGMSSWFRKRKRDLVVFATAGSVLLVLLSIGNGRIFNLPLPVQRAMSFLPGDWDYRAVSDAQGSSEWRFEMWKLVLTEDKWIKNKVLGDGFGLSGYDLSVIEGAKYTGFGMINGHQNEWALMVGAYHSGPLSTIRYVGYVGLALFFPLMLLLAFRGVKLINRSRGTPLFHVALFVGMPVAFAPLVYVFMVGAFDSNMPEALFSAGLLKMLERALAKFENDESRTSQVVPSLTPRLQRPLQPAAV